MQRMAIQNRRGAYADFDPSKLKPGEYAIVQSGDPSTTEGDAIYICIKSGTVRRLATADEVNDYEEVIQLLKRLAADNRRSIGIISHVTTLKESITKQIVVKKGQSGSALTIIE